MVRTRANDTGCKAVGAKAPRKVLGSSGGGGASSSSSSSMSTTLGSPAANKHAGGNPYCPRPTPEWQKSLDCFFKKSPSNPDKENLNHPTVVEGTGGGSSSSSQKVSQSSSGSCDQAGSSPSGSPVRKPVISDDEDD